VSANLSINGADGTFGGEIGADIPLVFPFQMPIINLSGYYRISESVRFSLEISDPLAPFLGNGRAYWGPYEAPGLLAFLGMNISL
jgi:hypothetical protein